MTKKKNEYLELVEKYSDIIEQEDLRELYKKRVEIPTRYFLALYGALILVLRCMEL